MSQETYSWLAQNILASEMAGRHLWWASGARREGHEPQIFPGPVPIDAVEKLLCSWSPVTSAMLDESAVIDAIRAGHAGPDLIRAIETARVESHKLVKASDDDSHIGVIGADAATHTYRDWLTGTIRETVASEDLAITSAGMFRGRAQAFVQIERPETAKGPGGVEFSPTIAYSTSLDGSWKSQINQTITLMICDNTARAGRMEGVSFKHTSQSGSKLGVFRGVSAALMRGETDFTETLNKLLAEKVSDSAFGRFLETLAPETDDMSPAKRTRVQRRKQEITQLYKSDPRAASWHGTAYGAWQAVNTHSQHMGQLRDTSGLGMTDTDLRAMKVYGDRIRPVKGESEDERVISMILATV